MPNIAKRGPEARKEEPTMTKRIKTEPAEGSSETDLAERQPEYTDSELETINATVPRATKKQHTGALTLPQIEAVPAVPIEVISIDSCDDEASDCSTENGCCYSSDDSVTDEELEFTFYTKKGDENSVYCKHCSEWLHMKDDIQTARDHVLYNCASREIRDSKRQKERHQRRKQRREHLN